MELQYAPPAKSPNRPLFVVTAGLVTTGLALLGVYMLDVKADTNVMGWYADYVIPAGAILVGLVASSGYGVASYVTGVKIRRSLLLTIVLLQVAAYFAADYVEFASRGPLVLKSTGQAISFPEYFHYGATHFAWKDEHSDKAGEPLGMAGYFFVALAIGGFALGSLVAPLALMKAPYCELCEAYMKRKKLAVLPADPADPAQGRLRNLMRLASAGDAAAVRLDVDALAPGSAKAAKLPRRVNLSLVCCPACHNGFLRATLMTGRGKQVHTTLLDKVEVTREFIEQFGRGTPLV